MDKKKIAIPIVDRKDFLDCEAEKISLTRQCEILGIARSSAYYEPVGVSVKNLMFMRLIDKHYTEMPFYGTRKLTILLRLAGHNINRKRVQRLMRTMGLEAIYAKPRTTVLNPNHKIYPYLLRGVMIDRPDQVWSTDITFIPMHKGFMYLVAIMDWFSRYVLGWRLSSTLDSKFCEDVLSECVLRRRPEIFNTDQGSQFTSKAFTGILEASEIKISMDGRGRYLDNIFIERLWRTVKYEDVYLKGYADGHALYTGLKEFFVFYNTKRIHQGLGYRTPASVYFQ
jgi:putative transposase